MGDAGLQREEEPLLALRGLSPEPRCDFLHHNMGIKSLTHSDTTQVINPGTGHGRKEHFWHGHHQILWFNLPFTALTRLGRGMAYAVLSAHSVNAVTSKGSW